MKTRLKLLAIAALAAANLAHADTAGIEVGGYRWSPDYTGTFSGDTGTGTPTLINVENDLGFSSDDHNIIWASLEHPVPFLPNFKIVSSDLATSASSTLTQQIEFNGVTYNTSANIATDIDFSNTEYTLYYELLDNWINLDAGLTIRQYDGMVRLVDQTNNQQAEEVLDFVLPLFYLKGRIDLPLTGVFVDGDINIISYDNDKVSDVSFGIGYESDIGLGAKAGYRTFTLKVDESGFTSDLDFKGAYISAFFHF